MKVTLSLGLAVALLAGCGQSIGTPSAMQSRAIAQTSSTGEPLLYVLHDGSHEISMLSLPEYKPVAEIKGFRFASGMCADGSGNVWVTNYRHGRFVVDRFAHGGTTIVSELRAPKAWRLNGCAVDPASGNLAAIGSDDYGNAWILVWRGARNGKVSRYPGLCCAAISAVYDKDGNLYVSGAPGGDDWWLTFGELPKGSAKLVHVTLDKQTLEPGTLQWDGTYVVLSTALSRRTGYVPHLNRIQVTGAKGHVVQVIEPDELVGDWSGGWAGGVVVFALHGNTAIGVASSNGHRFLAAWAYPGGGATTGTVARYKDVSGLVVSP